MARKSGKRGSSTGETALFPNLKSHTGNVNGGREDHAGLDSVDSVNVKKDQVTPEAQHGNDVVLDVIEVDVPDCSLQNHTPPLTGSVRRQTAAKIAKQIAGPRKSSNKKQVATQKIHG